MPKRIGLAAETSQHPCVSYRLCRSCRPCHPCRPCRPCRPCCPCRPEPGQRGLRDELPLSHRQAESTPRLPRMHRQPCMCARSTPPPPVHPPTPPSSQHSSVIACVMAALLTPTGPRQLFPQEVKCLPRCFSLVSVTPTPRTTNSPRRGALPTRRRSLTPSPQSGHDRVRRAFRQPNDIIPSPLHEGEPLMGDRPGRTASRIPSSCGASPDLVRIAAPRTGETALPGAPTHVVEQHSGMVTSGRLGTAPDVLLRSQQHMQHCGLTDLPRYLIPIVEALLSGQTDETVSRKLGISPRTYSRRVAELLEHLEVSTRFQGGAELMRRCQSNCRHRRSERPSGRPSA